MRKFDKLVAFIVMMPFFIPAYLYDLYDFGKISVACKIFSTIIVLFYLFPTFNLSKIAIWMIILHVWLIIISFANNELPIFTISSLVMCLATQLVVFNGEPRSLKYISIYLIGIILLNFISVLLYPDGMYNNGWYDRNWLLGYKNPLIRTILPSFVLLTCFANIKSNIKLIFVACYVIVNFLTLYLVDSVTGFLGLSFFCIFSVLMWSFEWLNRQITIIRFFIFTIAIDYGIIFLNIQYHASFVINNIFNRNVSMTGRTYIWNQALELISQNYLFGYGEYAFPIGYASHPHNFVLHLTLQGGVILLIFLLIIFNKIDQVFKQIGTTVDVLVLKSCLMSFLLMGVVESNVGTTMFFPMMLFLVGKEKIFQIRVLS